MVKRSRRNRCIIVSQFLPDELRKNDAYEQLLVDYNTLQRERQNVGTQLNLFLALSAILAISTAYLLLKRG